MKSILERALVHLLNEENEKAEELLHQFVIETARDIHENLREGDEADLDAALEEGDEFFTESDLEDEGAEDAVAELGDDLGEEMPEVADADEMSDDTLDADAGMDLGGDEMGAEAPADDIESEIENFEQELADLQSKFDAMLADIEGEDDVADEDFGGDDLGDDLGADDLGADDLGGDVADEAGEEEAAFGDEDLVKEEEEDFDDITESVVDELQKVAAETREGMGTNGEDLLGNHESMKFTKPEAGATKAQSTKRVGHTGYARETAPSSQALKGSKTVVTTKMKNVRNDADAGNHKVTSTSEGPKAAIRATSKDAAHAKGPISGKPVGKK
jgi:hypothetical protein